MFDYCICAVSNKTSFHFNGVRFITDVFLVRDQDGFFLFQIIPVVSGVLKRARVSCSMSDTVARSIPYDFIQRRMSW